ncbi:thioredoxin [soil metagenome]
MAAASANLVEFTDKNFKSEVIDATQPVLVDFWAEWCGPCRALTPTIAKIADRYVGKAKVGKLNTDDAQATAAQFGISAIPTVILFNGGKEVKRFVGLRPETEFAGALDAITAK